jgi:hypothetical protein
MERPNKPKCERCKIDLGVRFDRGKAWSYREKKWLDLCKPCRQWMLQSELYDGLAPRRDFGRNP